VTATIPDEAVRLALAARAGALIDRPDPMVLSDETLTRLMLEAAWPALVPAMRAGRLADAGCPSVAHPDRELAAALFGLLADRASPRAPVPGGTWLRESGGSGTVACEECGRLTADGIDWMNLAQVARDHAAETRHAVIVQASQIALYGPGDDDPREDTPS
jgi:hypothetical protein